MLPQLSFAVGSSGPTKRHQVWRHIVKTPQLSVRSVASFDRCDEVFAIGSCFANEIRATLEEGNVMVHPAIDPELRELFVDDVKVDPRWGVWDERVHYQCFTPFTIRQEIEGAIGDWVPSPDSILECRLNGKRVYADPYRRSVYARTREDALEIRRRMSDRVREGLEKARVVVMTLGLVEAFQLVRWGGFLSEYNPVLGEENFEFINGDYAQIHRELKTAVESLQSHFPQKTIVLTVSPIPIARTFSSSDAITATMRGKSILRACADSIIQEFSNVHYWPSYEFAMWSGNAFCPQDVRHVTPEAVRKITSAFCEAFFDPSVVRAIESRSRETEAIEATPVKRHWMDRFRRTLRRAA